MVDSQAQRFVGWMSMKFNDDHKFLRKLASFIPRNLELANPPVVLGGAYGSNLVEYQTQGMTLY